MTCSFPSNTPKPTERERDREQTSRRGKARDQIQTERKGYITANGFMQSHTHTHTHTGRCGGVMGRDVPELGLLQVTEPQVCVCVSKWKRCMCNE